jgi:phage terminase large subunit
MFKRTTAINKIAKMKARKKVIQGGTSAGKTYAIVPLLIDIATKFVNYKITIVAETLPAVKEGALDIFKTIMSDTERWLDSEWNASTLTYTFKDTKTRIQFKSFDTVGKAKASGKRDILFINEANHIPFDVADTLMIRSRFTYIDFNPDNEFWVHTEVMTSKTAEFLLLTYEDNEGLSAETLEDLIEKKEKAFYNIDLPKESIFDKENIKSEYWANWCRVYIFGEIGNLQGVIFHNWKQIDNIPKEARLIGYGLDFGYTNDPTAIIEVYVWNGQRILNEICYNKGLSNAQIAKFVTTKQPVYCDSAEPKSIAELKNYGLNAKPVTKGADSVKFGIQTIQQNDYLVTSKSINLIKELRKYAWAKDKSTGGQLNTPIDNWNHAIDAWRYHEMEVLGIGIKSYATRITI